jgi:hypothetical protein
MGLLHHFVPYRHAASALDRVQPMRRGGIEADYEKRRCAMYWHRMCIGTVWLTGLYERPIATALSCRLVALRRKRERYRVVP